MESREIIIVISIGLLVTLYSWNQSSKQQMQQQSQPQYQYASEPAAHQQQQQTVDRLSTCLKTCATSVANENMVACIEACKVVEEQLTKPYQHYKPQPQIIYQQKAETQSDFYQYLTIALSIWVSILSCCFWNYYKSHQQQVFLYVQEEVQLQFDERKSEFRQTTENIQAILAPILDQQESLRTQQEVLQNQLNQLTVKLDESIESLNQRIDLVKGSIDQSVAEQVQMNQFIMGEIKDGLEQVNLKIETIEFNRS